MSGGGVPDKRGTLVEVPAVLGCTMSASGDDDG
jgi:hypothetical protein